MFLLHYGWSDGNGTQYGGSLHATIELAEAARDKEMKRLNEVKVTPRGEVIDEVEVTITPIEFGGDFFGEIY